MYGLDNQSGVNAMPALAPVKSLTPLWFTEGGSGLAPSYPGQDWFNMVQAEMLGVLTKGGIKPEKGKLNQLAEAIGAIVESGNYASTDYVDNGLNKKIDKTSVTQVTGESTTHVMSQKAVTDLSESKQAANENLSALASLDGTHNSFPYFMGFGKMTLGTITDYGKGLINKIDNQGFYSYTGIKTAGLCDVGTGAGQIPDMSSFSASDSMFTLPSGIVYQTFQVKAVGVGAHTVSFPTAFANKCLGVWTQQEARSGAIAETLAVTYRSKSGFNYFIDGDNVEEMTYTVLAIGR